MTTVISLPIGKLQQTTDGDRTPSDQHPFQYGSKVTTEYLNYRPIRLKIVEYIQGIVEIIINQAKLSRIVALLVRYISCGRP